MFLLIDWLSFGEGGGSFEIGRPRSRRPKNFGPQGGVEGLENWTIFMDVIYVSSHISKKQCKSSIDTIDMHLSVPSTRFFIRNTFISKASLKLSPAIEDKIFAVVSICGFVIYILSD